MRLPISSRYFLKINRSGGNAPRPYAFAAAPAAPFESGFLRASLQRKIPFATSTTPTYKATIPSTIARISALSGANSKNGPSGG